MADFSENIVLIYISKMGYIVVKNEKNNTADLFNSLFLLLQK